MAKYMIHATHEPKECLRTLDAYLQAGAHYLTRTEWGCEVGVHEEWMIVEAESLAEATQMVPPIHRKDAEVVMLTKYTPEQIRRLHAEELACARDALVAAI